MPTAQLNIDNLLIKTLFQVILDCIKLTIKVTHSMIHQLSFLCLPEWNNFFDLESPPILLCENAS